MKLKPKSNYLLDRYDGDGIFICKKCGFGVFSSLGIDVYTGSYDNMKFIGSYCERCTKELFCEIEPVSEPEHTPMTYNDIINRLDKYLKAADDEPNDSRALSCLCGRIQQLINYLQSESPSQTPSP